MVSSFLFLLFIEKLLLYSLIIADAVLILKSHYILEVLLKEMVKTYLTVSQIRVTLFSTDISMVPTKDQRMVEMSSLAELQSPFSDHRAS